MVVAVAAVDVGITLLVLVLLLLLLILLSDLGSGFDTFLEGTVISSVPSLLRMWVALLLEEDKRDCR